MTDAANRPEREDKDGEYLALFIQELDGQVSRYQRRRRRDKRKAFILQMGTVVMSATITVLLGLTVPDRFSTHFINIALVLGALTTVLAAWEAFFNHRELWLIRTATVRDLEGLRRDVLFRTLGGEAACSRTELNSFRMRMNDILRRDDTAWADLRAAGRDNRVGGATSQPRQFP